MEIRINSDFIENFVTKYQENAAKAIKYLAVLGIHFLETINKPDLSFEQLQAFASKTPSISIFFSIIYREFLTTKARTRSSSQ